MRFFFGDFDRFSRKRSIPFCHVCFVFRFLGSLFRTHASMRRVWPHFSRDLNGSYKSDSARLTIEVLVHLFVVYVKNDVTGQKKSEVSS